MPPLAVIVALVLALAAGVAHAADPPEVRLALEVTPLEATVGDPIQVTLTVELPADVELTPAELGPAIGAFSVLAGDWSGPQPQGDGNVWIWQGSLGAYETGELEIPAIRVTVDGPAGQTQHETEPVAVQIVSVLPEADADSETLELADLKPPASLEADLGPVWAALGILGLLLLGALVFWWVHRRYGHKLAEVETDDDLFRRIPPHVWVYSELQKLLERRLPETGQIDLFYSELSRILKLYLGGRYRVALMEETTAEVPATLEQAGAPGKSIEAACEVLADSDRVKFAQALPGPDEWKAAVEELYRIVDATRPADAETPAAARGAG